MNKEIKEIIDSKTVEKYGWWNVKFEITLEDEEETIRFDDLSEETQEHICKQISDGVTSGQFCEVE